MTGDKEKQRGVKTTTTIFGIIELLHDVGPLSLTEIADELGFSPGTIHAHLNTLENMGYIVNDDGYRLSLRMLDFGSKVREEHTITPSVRPTLRRLADETDALVEFVKEERGLEISLSIAKGERGLTTIDRIGNHLPMHLTASGKAILAYKPEEEVREIIGTHGLEPKTEFSITSKDDLKKELAEIADNGFAQNDEELVEGIRAVASPIIAEDIIYGAISVVGQKDWMRDDRFNNDIPEAVVTETNELGLKIRYGRI